MLCAFPNASLVAEYGISRATVSNWVHSYREECQNNDEEKFQLEMMEELRRLRLEKAELEKENSFLLLPLSLYNMAGSSGFLKA